MDNANKAIIMAFGMLVAVMILGTIVFVFTRLKALPTQDDSLEEIEQRRLFNQEYEVYDKKLMYGVDIISVLNKAQSNNDKYIKGNFLSGVNYNTDYAINIVVEFKSVLQEKFEVTYLQNLGSTVSELEYAGESGPSGVTTSSVFKVPSSTYQGIIYGVSDFWNSTELKNLATRTIDTNIGQKNVEYQLLDAATTVNPNSDKITNDMLENDESDLKQLMTQSATMSQTVRNRSNNKYEYEVGWNRATWYPAVYDMKTRKFKCEGNEITYNSKTGRICYMKFKEI